MPDSIPGLFASGCIVGIVLAYTGFVGFLAGVWTGILIQTRGPQLGNACLLVVSNTVDRVTSVLTEISANSKPVKSKDEKQT